MCIPVNRRLYPSITISRFPLWTIIQAAHAFFCDNFYVRYVSEKNANETAEKRKGVCMRKICFDSVFDSRKFGMENRFQLRVISCTLKLRLYDVNAFIDPIDPTNSIDQFLYLHLNNHAANDKCSRFTAIVSYTNGKIIGCPESVFLS